MSCLFQPCQLLHTPLVWKSNACSMHDRSPNTRVSSCDDNRRTGVLTHMTLWWLHAQASSCSRMHVGNRMACIGCMQHHQAWCSAAFTWIVRRRARLRSIKKFTMTLSRQSVSSPVSNKAASSSSVVGKLTKTLVKRLISSCDARDCSDQQGFVAILSVE